MRIAIATVCVLLSARAAWAEFHLMKITEVFPGTVAQPNAQYVELTMYVDGQNLVNAHFVRVYDAAGTAVATYTFTADVGVGVNQATILIATTQAETLFNVSSDLQMTPTIGLASGMVCFENIDCVAWGNFVGTPPSGVGTPAYQARGLIRGRGIARKLGANAILDPADDTGVSANDFAYAIPSPKNNTGVMGANPVNNCGNNAIEGLESCDDNNTTSNDGCSSACISESCGDGVVQTSEQCDDTNTITTDTCSTTCMTQMAQPDAPPDGAGAGPDVPTGGGGGGGGIVPTNDDGGGCCQTGGPGVAPGLGLLVLGLLLRRRRVT